MAELLTLSEVANRLRLSKRTIIRYINRGHLDAIKLDGGWRISEDALSDFLSRRRTRSYAPQFETKDHA
jgi:excisionase family DNA binding protein